MECIIIIIIIIIPFMQGIYTYMSETNHIPVEYSVAAISNLLFMVHINDISKVKYFVLYISITLHHYYYYYYYYYYVHYMRFGC